MAKIRTGEITTHVQRIPSAIPAPDGAEPPVVVFVHGLLTDSLASYYFTLGPAFAAAGHDVVMYDLRGHGRSDRPDTGYRLDAFVGDLLGLLDGLDVTVPVHLVGNSFGGTIATAFSAWHPDRVATVTMIEAEPPVAGWNEHMRAGLADAKRQLVLEESISWIAARHGAHTARLSRNAGRILGTTTLAEDVPLSRTIDDDLSALTRPLLAVFGDESGLSAQAPQLEERVSGCRTVILPEQGHSVLVEQPAVTRDLVMEWIAAHTPAGALR